jgi:hypothetical protein
MASQNDFRFTRLTLFFGLLFGINQAQAGEVHTPGMSFADLSGKSGVQCYATNVSRHVEEVTFTLYTREGLSGSPDETLSSVNITVQPNETFVLGGRGQLISPDTTARCSISGNGVNSKDWRLSICVGGLEARACLGGY